MEHVKLENFLKKIDGALEGDQAEAGELLVFPHVGVERGEEFARFHNGVVWQLAIRAQEAVADVDRIQEMPQCCKVSNVDIVNKTAVFFAGKGAFAEGIFPRYGHEYSS